MLRFRNRGVVVVDDHAACGEVHPAMPEPEKIPVVAVRRSPRWSAWRELVKLQIGISRVVGEGVGGAGEVSKERFYSDIPIHVILDDES